LSFRQCRQSTPWQIRDRGTVDISGKCWPNCRLWFQKLTELLTVVLKVDRTVEFQHLHPTTVEFSKESPATVDLWSKVDCRHCPLICACCILFYTTDVQAV
jgi:hypothetical protein